MKFLERISRAFGLRESPPESAGDTAQGAEHGYNPYLGVVQSQERHQFPPEEFAADESDESDESE